MKEVHQMSISGPNMPIPLRGSAAVTTPQGMILVGHSKYFFKLQAKYNGTMEWETLPLNLKNVRGFHVAFLILDSLSHCSNPYILDHNTSKNGTSKIIEMTDSQLFILLLVVLIVGISISINLHICKRNFLCFKIGELPPIVENAMIPLQKISYEENKNYDCLSISFEMCKISNSQLCLKKEIGKYLMNCCLICHFHI